MYREAMTHLMKSLASQDGGDQASGDSKGASGSSQGSSSSGGGLHVPVHVEVQGAHAGREALLGGMIDCNTRTKVWDLAGDDMGKANEMGVEGEGDFLRRRLEAIRKRREEVAQQRELVARRTAELSQCRSELLSRAIELDARKSDLVEAQESCRSRRVLYSEQLVNAMKMGALNDSFHIWNRGPFATINGFRVGRLQTNLVDWQEINAGVGQAALVLVTVAMGMGVEFSKYLIAPCGSFTKIARSEDGRVLYSLHTDESFSLFPRRNFNLALKAFLHCLGEVGERVLQHDPTLRLPYRIKEKEGTIGGLPVSLGSSLDDWTRALKYMITDLKWIAAWAAKYLPPC